VGDNRPVNEVAGQLSLPTSAIEGIGRELSGQLKEQEIYTVGDLLRVEPRRLQAALHSRRSLAEIRSWCHMASFLQIGGMTPQWAEALVREGFATPRDIRSRDLPGLRKLFTKARDDGIAPDVPKAATIAEMMKEAAINEFAGALNGTIVDEDDKPVTGASVRIGREHEVSDKRGRFRIIRIPFTAKSTLAISHPDFLPARFRLRRVETSNFIGSKVFRVRRLRAGGRPPKRVLMEARGDVLPPVGDARIALREVERENLFEHDVFALTEFSADMQRGKLVSKLLAYEDGEFWLQYVWVPLSELKRGVKSGDCFVLRRDAFEEIRMDAIKLRGWPVMLRTMRRMGAPPSDPDDKEAWLKKGVELMRDAGRKRERL
jgi:hypothetical protein